MRNQLIDTLRGLAILLMVAFHTVFNLNFFFEINNPWFQNLLWQITGRSAAILFILMAGAVTGILEQKYKGSTLLKKNLKRGLRLLALALIISLISWTFYPSKTIYFGIIHFLGLGIILSSFFHRLKYSNLVIGTIIIFIGFHLPYLNNTIWILLPFGLFGPNFSSFDYVPLFPWFGVILYGLYLGKYVLNKHLKISSPNYLSFIGKYSLWIYFLHQPILLGLIYLIQKL